MRANVDVSSPEFRARLTALRTRLDLTKPELAARAGVSARSVHDLESGIRNRAQEKTLRLIAKALGVSFEMLACGADVAAPPAPPETLPEAVRVESPPWVRRRLGWLVIAVLIAGSSAIGLGLGGGKHTPPPEDDPVPVFVTDFENVVDPGDPEHLGTIIANLVAGDLSASRYLRVISSRAVATAEVVDDSPGYHEDSASIQAAMRAGAKWKVCGSVLRMEPTVVVTSRIEDTADGTVLASQEVSVAENETLFDAAHRLSAAIKRDLVLPPGAKAETGLPLSPVTTPSIAAYRHYSEGCENLRLLYRDRARADFRMALRDDPSFAMAYVMLAHPDIVLSREECDSLVSMARSCTEGVTHCESLYVEAFEGWCRDDIPGLIVAFEKMVESYPQESEAYRLLGRFYESVGEPAKARAALEGAVRVDPFDGLTINRLAYLYAKAGETDAALRLIDRYITLAPSQANPYDTRGDILAWSGRVDEAIRSYEMALERNPQFFPSMQSLGVTMTLTRRYEAAARYFRMMLASEDSGARSRARWLLGAVDVYQGRLGAARSTLEAALASDGLEADTGEAVMRKVCLQAVIEEELGNFDTALAVYRHTVETSRVTQPGTVDDWPARWVSVLARQDTTAAAAVVDSIAASMTDTPVDEQHAYWGCRGWLELSKGNAQAACAWFERAVGAQDQMWYRYPLGLAYLEAGRADDAIRTFEGILTWYSISRLVEPSWAVKTYYHLGRSYETAGRTADAERLYLEFLDVWSTADPVFDEVTEARARLAQLASGM